MDHYPFLEKWLSGELAGANALVGLVFLIGVALLVGAYLIRRYPKRAELIARLYFNGFCVLAILYMLVIR
jgi:hypothetical protein